MTHQGDKVSFIYLCDFNLLWSDRQFCTGSSEDLQFLRTLKYIRLNSQYSFIQQSIIVYIFKKYVRNYPLNYCINSYKFWRTNYA
jgi:hypothetical protein